MLSGMATWNAVYVRDSSYSESKSLQGLRHALFGAVAVRRSREWTELALAGLQDAEALARRLSLEVGAEVLWAQIQTTARVLCLVHCVAGEVRRKLVHSDGGWLTIEGTTQPWEAVALFNEARLDDALDGCDGDEEEEARVRRLFRERTLIVGSDCPSLHEFECLWTALGMDFTQWEAFRATAPVAHLEGSKGRGKVWLARALILGAGVCAVLLVATGEALFILLTVLLLGGGGFAALKRWLEAGRWLS
jgi:hypothetical protein